MHRIETKPTHEDEDDREGIYPQHRLIYIYFEMHIEDAEFVSINKYKSKINQTRTLFAGDLYTHCSNDRLDGEKRVKRKEEKTQSQPRGMSHICNEQSRAPPFLGGLCGMRCICGHI